MATDFFYLNVNWICLVYLQLSHLSVHHSNQRTVLALHQLVSQPAVFEIHFFSEMVQKKKGIYENK